jgi:hypothetical protein
MAFDAKAFAAAFARGQATDIRARVAEAKAYKEKEEERAERNQTIIEKREAQKDVLLGYAATLSKIGAMPERIMYFAKNGPLALKKIHDIVLDKAEEYKNSGLGDKLSKEDINDIMKIPEEQLETFSEAAKKYKSVEDFLDAGYRLSKQNDSVEKPETPEILKGNFLLGMLGVGAKERMKQKLETEKFLGDYTIGQINRLAAQKDFIDPFGGAFGTAAVDPTAGPVILDVDTVVSMEKLAQTKYINKLKNAQDYINDYKKQGGEVGEDEFDINEAIKNDDISKIKNDPGLLAVYNQIKDNIKYEALQEATKGTLNDSTIRQFRPEYQDLYERKTEKEEKTKEEATGQGATDADFASKAEFKKAKDERKIVADKEYTYIEGGEIKTKSFTQSELDIHYGKINIPSADVSSSQAKGVLSQEEFNALPPDVGDPPGTMLSPSGATRDARDEWFEKYGDTHNTSGIKKTYSQYVADMTPSKRSRR